MHDFQRRVVDEKKALDEKLEKLATFVNTGAYRDLEAGHQVLLSAQYGHMHAYSAILGARLASFSEEA
jgi:hypothetical protein